MATWAMRQRYAWIDARLAAGEPFNRDDLVKAFTVTKQTASATIHQYQELQPDALRYDVSRKAFVRSDAPATAGLSRREIALSDALRRLVMLARTSGGTAGPDAALMAACAEVEAVLAPSTNTNSGASV